MKLLHEKIKTIKTVCRLSANIIITGHEDRSICVWDLSLPIPLVKILKTIYSPHEEAILSPLIIKINEDAFACRVSQGILIRNINTDSYRLLKCNGDNIVALMLNAKGKLISASADYKDFSENKITVWNIQDYTNKTAFSTFSTFSTVEKKLSGYPNHMFVLPDNRIVFSTYCESDGGGSIVIWDAEKNVCFCLPPSGKGRITGLTLGHNNELIALFHNGRLEQWDLEKKELISSADHNFGVCDWHDAKIVCKEYVATISSKDISFLSLTGQHRNTLYTTSFACFSDPIQHDELWMKVADNCIVSVVPARLSSANGLHNYFMGGGYYSHSFDADYDTLMTLIHCNYNPEEMRSLVKFSRDRNQLTALHLAVLHNNSDLAKRLVAMSDGTLSAKNIQGKTPYDLAKELQNINLIHFLRSNQYTATINK